MSQLTEDQHLLLRKLVYNELVRLEQMVKVAKFPMFHSESRLERVRELDGVLAAQRRAWLKNNDKLVKFMTAKGSTPNYET